MNYLLQAARAALRYHPAAKHANIRFLQPPPVTTQYRRPKTHREEREREYKVNQTEHFITTL